MCNSGWRIHGWEQENRGFHFAIKGKGGNSWGSRPRPQEQRQTSAYRQSCGPERHEFIGPKPYLGKVVMKANFGERVGMGKACEWIMRSRQNRVKRALLNLR